MTLHYQSHAVTGLMVSGLSEEVLCSLTKWAIIGENQANLRRQVDLPKRDFQLESRISPQRS